MGRSYVVKKKHKDIFEVQHKHFSGLELIRLGFSEVQPYSKLHYLPILSRLEANGFQNLG